MTAAATAQQARLNLIVGGVIAAVVAILLIGGGIWCVSMLSESNYETREQQRKIHEDQLVGDGIKTGIKCIPAGHDHVWITNNSSIMMTNVKVDVVVYQNGTRVDGASLSWPEIPPGNIYWWQGVLWIPDSNIGSGSTLTVQCDQLLKPRIFTYP